MLAYLKNGFLIGSLLLRLVKYEPIQYEASRVKNRTKQRLAFGD